MKETWTDYLAALLVAAVAVLLVLVGWNEVRTDLEAQNWMSALFTITGAAFFVYLFGRVAIKQLRDAQRDNDRTHN